MRWITALSEAAGGAACAWIVRRDDLTAERAAATPLPDDFAHAARARAGDGGAGRLWRRRLLRALAARRLGVHPDAIVFAHGEPRPGRLLAPGPLFVSAASRGAWTVVAAGPRPLGVDVEAASAEIAAFCGSPTETLRAWTATEAYVKATGCGLDLAWEIFGAVRGARLQVPGFPACAMSWRQIGDVTFAAAEA